MKSPHKDSIHPTFRHSGLVSLSFNPNIFSRNHRMVQSIQHVFSDRSEHDPWASRISYKKSIVTTLFQRAENLTSNNAAMENERQYVTNVLKQNNYPNSFLYDCLRRPTLADCNSPEGDLRFPCERFCNSPVHCTFKELRNQSGEFLIIVVSRLS